MRSIFGWIDGWLLWPGSNGDMICANRIIFCTLRRPSSVLSRRTVWRAIKSFSWIPAGRKNHLHETFWKMMVNLSWVDGAQVGVVLNKTVRDWVTFSTTRAVLSRQHQRQQPSCFWVSYRLPKCQSLPKIVLFRTTLTWSTDALRFNLTSVT